MIQTGGPCRAFFTIGHSTRSLDQFVDLLREAGAETVVDVRKMPRSRANPQFNIETLPCELEARQLGYRHIAALGGLRGRSPDASASRNTLWRNASFRNYADYALTPAFRSGLTELIALGRERTCAIMCSEALWWRCHRRIIADYLLARGRTVLHLMAPARAEPASLTPGAVPQGEAITYPAA